ncbi:Saccharopine dehydrogenase [Metarhizium acridum]|uniref:Saccharopine dehydrogenase n=1 Tax=Metarhizium acridum TaxID=92637 RepID=UPI001C6A96AE|nr:Saccharopine dehydrogenase [Metarhizium acridum]KAG8426967.1 Saccharopine dehydrogenase [Metarhizium acridum]
MRVEEYPKRIYKTDEFKAASAEVVPTGSWVNAPTDHIILGLKELEADGHPFYTRLQETTWMGYRAVAFLKGRRFAL